MLDLHSSHVVDVSDVEKPVGKIGTCLMFEEPYECPEVPYPELVHHHVSQDTEWSVEAAYEESGYQYRGEESH